MGQAWVKWVVVLAIIGVIVVVVATRGGEKKEAAGAQGAAARQGGMVIDENKLKFGQQTYNGIVDLLTKETSERGQQEWMRRIRQVLGHGTILTVTQPQQGLYSFDLDADPPDGAAEVTIDVKADNFRGEVPSVGQHVKYTGLIMDWEWRPDTRKVMLWVEKGNLEQPKK